MDDCGYGNSGCAGGKGGVNANSARERVLQKLAGPK